MYFGLETTEPAKDQCKLYLFDELCDELFDELCDELFDELFVEFQLKMASRLDLKFRDDLIERIFRLGYNHAEILSCLLLLHDRRLARRGLKRRKASSDLTAVLTAVKQELQGSGSNVGYRSMWQRLVTDYGLPVCKDTVRYALRILDTDVVNRRRRHRLQRRQYKGREPNFIRHIDGYVKLKPFGFAILKWL